jgi:hypothetical protein
VDGRTVAERIAALIVRRAMKGDIRFIKEVLDRVEGKAIRQVADSGPEATRIEVVYTHDWGARSEDRADNPGRVEG